MGEHVVPGECCQRPTCDARGALAILAASGNHAAMPRLCLVLLSLALMGCPRDRAAPDASSATPDPVTALLDTLGRSGATPSRPSGGAAAGATRHLAVDQMLATSNDGRWGYLLEEVGGPVLHEIAADEAFEPASTLKTVYLLHALQEVQAGRVSLKTPVPWFRASTVADDPATPEDEREYGCPLDRDPATGELGTGLRLMMERSDNRWTQAVRRYFGDEPLRATAREAGMASTVMRHRIGCAEALDAPNASTLRDLCGLMRGAAAGTLLSEENATIFLDLMANDLFIRLRAIFDDEGAALGLPPAVIRAVERRQMLAWKSGKYNIGEYKCQSVVGLARLVSWDAGALRSREYVFGVFVDDARSFPEQGTRATLFSLAVASELLRSEVSAVLASFRAALTAMP